MEHQTQLAKGALDVKVPEVETDEEFKQLNQNFNQMIERLKEQQDKLLITKDMKHGKVLLEN